ncbi:hypothetical protein ST21_022 [Aeromonas phage ST21]|uniref:Uncharacterized protein n=1 Tax=Aeromonas phage ST21 TaxID=3065691 RepID=A0AA96EVJ5_9CAUD|nr:hypothetical protein ST21_022 [Aeromonas phage ST21]
MWPSWNFKFSNIRKNNVSVKSLAKKVLTRLVAYERAKADVQTKHSDILFTEAMRLNAKAEELRKEGNALRAAAQELRGSAHTIEQLTKRLD